jgi:septum site-determining protein MinD
LPEKEYFNVYRKVIGIISGKGGVGKTTCTINLCAALTDMKRDVIAVDADMKMAGLGLQLGMFNFHKTLNDLLVGRGQLYEAIYTHESGMKIIPSSLTTLETSLFNIRDVFEHPYMQHKIVLVDSPPGIENNTMEIVRACTDMIVVTTPEIPSVTNALKVLTLARDFGVNPLGVVVNMFNKNDPNQISPQEIEAIFEIPLIGVVPYDKLMRKSVFKRKPIVHLNPYSPASIEFKKMAHRITNREYIPDKFLPLRRLIWGLKNEK